MKYFKSIRNKKGEENIMAELNHSVYSDPTLDAMNKAMELKQKLDKPRNYLGASEIGHDCERYLFYSFRNACKRNISAKGLKAIQDGYDQEAKTIERLRALPFIELINEDEEGNQIGFETLLGHYKGHCDGMIHGLLQAPKTWHVFEHKSVNEKKFNDLKKTIEEKGEKEALYNWDMMYYAQAQSYMHEFQLERHYTVVSTPGGRDHISCRTEYKRAYAERILEKTKNIIFENWTIPAKISDKREFFKCQWCHMKGICHDGDFPDVHCKTCRYREAIDGGKNKCLATDTIIEETLLNVGCPSHIYNPALISGAKLLEHQDDGCIYQVEGKDYVFANTNLTGFPDVKGKIDGIFTSKQLREDVKNIHDITNQMLNAFKGTMIEPEKAEKAWNKSNKWEI